jgi:hypothetical protein
MPTGTNQSQIHAQHGEIQLSEQGVARFNSPSRTHDEASDR